MNVLILSTADQNGGAATAAKRLLDALRGIGVDAYMLVKNKYSDDPFVYTTTSTKIGKMLNFVRFVWERLVIFVCNKGSKKNLFKISIANTGINISKHPLVQQADVIHLHWINQGFLSLNNIQQLINLRKPIVWTMHDMWACTGICHHARNCDKNRRTCYSCYFLTQSKGNDLATKIFDKKKKMYENADINFVTCSSWLEKLVRQSSLCKNKKIYAIPNPIDTTIFYPKSKVSARAKLGLTVDKKLILFAAVNGSDKRKGLDYLINALQLMDTKDLELVVLGNLKTHDMNDLHLPIHQIGYLTDESIIASLYSAADVFVTPSLEENLPNTVMEALACATPCVGFDIGGIPEMIDHKINGYVAQYQNVNDLANGIAWVLDYTDQTKLSMACVEKVRNNFNAHVVAQKYVALYEKIIDEQVDT